MQRNRQDLYSIDVNHDVYMDKYPDLTPESLGEHLFNYRGKYHIACCINECRYWSSTDLFTGAGGGFDYNYVTSSLPEKAASFSNVLSEH